MDPFADPDPGHDPRRPNLGPVSRPLNPGVEPVQAAMIHS